MKNIINKYLRKFGAEIHGVGYIQKLKNSDVNKSEWEAQKKALGGNAKVIFDLGANRGQITSKYLEDFPGASIHAFEPFPQSCELFNSLHGENENVTLNKVAVGSKEGISTMSVNESVDTNSLLESTKIGATSDKSCKTLDTIEVHTTTLDIYCKKNEVSSIDILKMDIQGYEMEVLKGAENLLASNSIKLIYTESYFAQQYVDQPLFHDLSKFLYSHDFVLQDFYDPYFSTKQLLWCDSIFVHKSTL